MQCPSVAPAPAAYTIIAGTLNQQVGGLGLYGFWNNMVYAGVAVYQTTKHGIAIPLGVGTTTDMVVHGAAPYWRLVLQHQWGEHYLSAGTYGMTAEIYPEGRTADRQTGLPTQPLMPNISTLGKSTLFRHIPHGFMRTKTEKRVSSWEMLLTGRTTSINS